MYIAGRTPHKNEVQQTRTATLTCDAIPISCSWSTFSVTLSE